MTATKGMLPRDVNKTGDSGNRAGHLGVDTVKDSLTGEEERVWNLEELLLSQRVAAESTFLQKTWVQF